MTTDNVTLQAPSNFYIGNNCRCHFMTLLYRIGIELIMQLALAVLLKRSPFLITFTFSPVKVCSSEARPQIRSQSEINYTVLIDISSLPALPNEMTTQARTRLLSFRLHHHTID